MKYIHKKDIFVELPSARHQMTEYHQQTWLSGEPGAMSWGSADAEGDDEELREACGVFGCVVARNTPEGSVNAAQVIYLGLVALQHRGQESAGIVTSEGQGCKQFQYHKGEGLVASIFREESLQKLKGQLGIGHTRYATMGGCDPINIQPFMVHTRHGPFATAHNGELINGVALRKTVLERGVGLSTRSDSELITQMLSLTPPRGEKDGPDWGARIRHLMEATPTAYSLALMHGDKVYGVRDPFGNRPLCIGRLVSLAERKGDTDMAASETDLGWVLSSESCAFQSIGATLIREVFPGEIIELSPDGIRSLDIVPRPKPAKPIKVGYEQPAIPHMLQIPPPAFCIFEYVYFSRADTLYEGQQVYSVRQRCGRQLAIETSVDADIISTVPESATPAAMGYALQSGIPYVEVLCRNRYVGRSFIQPDTRSRQLAVAKKFGAIAANLEGRRVVLVDDSIVRGTTIGPLVRLLKQYGAKEVHIRIASPPIQHPCYMGINIPTKGELIANTKAPEELAGFIGADSLAYLSIEGLVKAVSAGAPKDKDMSGYCTACLDGNYPVHLEW
ncbi:amidophosphoribosyltransferase-like isoform X2 [Penaeus japonicus]|uniref:amidophosphoribosyltransferase-like isoform X2 n=1 Tax=Penaeus japonicus TaxID=27405 RepID=UPI001C70B392|nr:amidophosphoribosyltransferase-like isoform X2 [Penaeus japonicus]